MDEGDQFTMEAILRLTQYLEAAFDMIEDLQIKVAVLEFREEMREPTID